MANRHFQNHVQHIVHDPVVVFVEFTVDGSGDPTLVDRGGVSSIAHTATGKYTVTLQDHYNALIGADIERPQEDADPQVFGHVISEDVNNTTTPVVVLGYKVEGGTATDPNASATLRTRLWLKNSAVGA